MILNLNVQFLKFIVEFAPFIINNVFVIEVTKVSSAVTIELQLNWPCNILVHVKKCSAFKRFKITIARRERNIDRG